MTGHSTSSKVIHPQNLLKLAHALAAGTGSPGRPLSAALRRSTSTSYYASFHAISLRTAKFIAPGLRRPEQLVVCRAITHRAVADAARAIANGRVPNVAPAKRPTVLNLAADPVTQLKAAPAAELFLNLYDARQDADYNHDHATTRQMALAHHLWASTLVTLANSRDKDKSTAMDRWCAAILLLA